jgi:hypothetical protein
MNHRPLHRRALLQQTGAWAVGTSALLSPPARATALMSPEQAMHLLMPDASDFAPLDVSLSMDVLGHISQLTGTRVPKSFAPRVWTATAKGQRIGWVALDRVIGKYDWIDYAAGFDTHGVTLGLEVLAYRESHGGEIRQAQWRGQFAGRKGPQALRWGDDIRNISGSTLSCQHVTEGMQRLSALMRLLA